MTDCINCHMEPCSCFPGKRTLELNADEWDSLKMILRQVYLSDFGSRIVEDARAIRKRME